MSGAHLIIPAPITNPLSSARVRSATQNINGGGGTNIIQWDAASFVGVPTDTVMSGTTGIQTLLGGFVRVTTMLSYIGGVPRYSPRVFARVNGVNSPTRGTGGYIRAATGDNEGGVVYTDIMAVNALDVIEIQVQRESGGGAAMTQGLGQGSFLVEYVAVV